MGKTVNVAILLGRVGTEPDCKYLPSGSMVMTFSLATDHSYKKNNEWVNETDWHNIEVWGDQAERLNGKLHKGLKMVHVEGKIRQENWETDDGKRRSKIKIVANRVMILDNVPAAEEASEDEDVEIVIPF